MTGNARFQTFPFYKRKCKRAFFFIQFAWADLYARIGVQMLQLSKISYTELSSYVYSFFSTSIRKELEKTGNRPDFRIPSNALPSSKSVILSASKFR